MTIRFRENSIEFENGTNLFTLNESGSGFTFTGAMTATQVTDGFQGTVSGYSSGGRDNSTYAFGSTIIDKFPFATNANATNVGNLTLTNKYFSSGQSSTVSGYTSGGANPSYGPNIFNIIDKFPFATNSSASDVGDLTVGKYGGAAVSSTVSGYMWGGNPSPVYNTLDKFPFATDSNSVSLIRSDIRDSGGQSSVTHGYASSATGSIFKFPFATESGSSSIGSLTVTRSYTAGQSSSVSGYTSGGAPGGPTYVNIIDKFPFASETGAVDVGDLVTSRTGPAGQSSTVSGYTSGGYTGPFAPSSLIDKFPFATDANATNVGNLSVARFYLTSQQD